MQTFCLTLEIASLVASYERQRRATCNIRTTILHLELSVEWPLLDTPPAPKPLPSAATIALIMRAATFCGTGFCQIVALPLATFADTQLVEDGEGGRERGRKSRRRQQQFIFTEGVGEGQRRSERVRECCACRTSKQNRIGIGIGAAAWHGICCIVSSPQATSRRRRRRRERSSGRRLPTLFAYPITDWAEACRRRGSQVKC